MWRWHAFWPRYQEDRSRHWVILGLTPICDFIWTRQSLLASHPFRSRRKLGRGRDKHRRMDVNGAQGAGWIREQMLLGSDLGASPSAAGCCDTSPSCGPDRGRCADSARQKKCSSALRRILGKDVDFFAELAHTSYRPYLPNARSATALIGRLRCIMRKFSLYLRRSRDSPLNCTIEYTYSIATVLRTLQLSSGRCSFSYQQNRYRDAVSGTPWLATSLAARRPHSNAMHPLHSTFHLNRPVRVAKGMLTGSQQTKTPTSILRPTTSHQSIFSPDADPISCAGEWALCNICQECSAPQARHAKDPGMPSIHKLQFSRERPTPTWPCIVIALCQEIDTWCRIQVADVEIVALGVDNTPTREVGVGQSVRLYYTSCPD